MSKPVIGITTAGRTEAYTTSKHYDEYYNTPVQYVDAVRRAGGIPLLIPAGSDDWDTIMKLLDGVIITGGTDVDPTEYKGNVNNPSLFPADPERDRTELSLARHMIQEKSTPLLCVCRGLQVLNVATGGTLHEHILDIRETDIHRSSDGLWEMQTVHVETDSLLAQMMGTDTVKTTSGHHQAVKDIGDGLRVVGTAPDGIIEAVEMPDHPWLVAVQWHPEVTAKDDATQQAIFDALVETSKARKLQKQALLS
jgi:putative glutamine amidotransferase